MEAASVSHFFHRESEANQAIGRSSLFRGTRLAASLKGRPKTHRMGAAEMYVKDSTESTSHMGVGGDPVFCFVLTSGLKSPFRMVTRNGLIWASIGPKKARGPESAEGYQRGGGVVLRYLHPARAKLGQGGGFRPPRGHLFASFGSSHLGTGGCSFSFLFVKAMETPLG